MDEKEQSGARGSKKSTGRLKRPPKEQRLIGTPKESLAMKGSPRSPPWISDLRRWRDPSAPLEARPAPSWHLNDGQMRSRALWCSDRTQWEIDRRI